MDRLDTDRPLDTADLVHRLLAQNEMLIEVLKDNMAVAAIKALNPPTLPVTHPADVDPWAADVAPGAVETPPGEDDAWGDLDAPLEVLRGFAFNPEPDADDPDDPDLDFNHDNAA